MSEETTTKYSSYTPAQKKASQLYRQKNKEKINEQRKKYYQTRKASDPSFLEYKRKKAKEYYEKNKLDKVVKTEVITDVEMQDVKVQENPVMVIEEVKVIDQPKEEVKLDKTDIEIVDALSSLKLIDPLPMPTLQRSEMDTDVFDNTPIPLFKPSMKTKRTSTKKKVKTDLEKTD